MSGLDASEAAASVRWFLQSLRSEAGRSEGGEGGEGGEGVSKGVSKRASKVDWMTFRSWVERRAQREPVQYILGTWPFYPLPKELLMRPPVLIPRPETEELVDRIINQYGHSHPKRLVDFGSGSGAIVVSLLHAFPAATAVAVDPSLEAVALTRENARRCSVESRLSVHHSSSIDWASTCTQSFDLIVSNPPYIPTAEIPGLQIDVRDFEDHSALDGGLDGLDIVAEVLRSARQVGLPGARIYLEVHHTHPSLFEALDEAESPRAAQCVRELQERGNTDARQESNPFLFAAMEALRGDDCRTRRIRRNMSHLLHSAVSDMLSWLLPVALRRVSTCCTQPAAYNGGSSRQTQATSQTLVLCLVR